MLDPRKQQEFEQAQAMLTETIPPMIWEMYVKFKQEGFREEQSMSLVIAFIMSLNIHSVM